MRRMRALGPNNRTVFLLNNDATLLVDELIEGVRI
jgi:hypothetical protein